MKQEQTIYDDMWRGSLTQFQAGDFVTDPLIQSESDTRRGLTVLARISGDAGRNISRFLHQFRAIEPAQYYYPTGDLHVTVLSVIACYEGFTLPGVDTDAYIQVVQQSLQAIEPFCVDFKGITASPSCVLIQGFAEDDQLALLRENLRNRFQETTLQTSIDTRYSIATAHATAARFQAPPENSERLIELLTAYREFPFGTLEIDRVELVCNDWYQRAGATKTLLHQSL